MKHNKLIVLHFQLSAMVVQGCGQGFQYKAQTQVEVPFQKGETESLRST